MASQFIEAPLLAQQHNTVPQVMYDHCKTLGLPFSGNAAGFASTTDLNGLPLGPYPQVLGWHQKGIGAMAGYVFYPPRILECLLIDDDAIVLCCSALRSRCVLTAVFGMATVVWYALGGHISEEEMEHEIRARIEAKAKKGKFFGLLRKRS